jgi:hypothetical protein
MYFFNFYENMVFILHKGQNTVLSILFQTRSYMKIRLLNQVGFAEKFRRRRKCKILKTNVQKRLSMGGFSSIRRFRIRAEPVTFRAGDGIIFR